MEVSKAVEIDELIAKFLSTPIPHCESTSGNFLALHKFENRSILSPSNFSFPVVSKTLEKSLHIQVISVFTEKTQFTELSIQFF